MSNNRGAILLSGLGFVSVFLVAVFALTHLLGILQEKRTSLNSCRQMTSRHLNQIKKNYKLLLALNPQALLLRMRWLQNQAELIAAQAALPESLPLVAKLLAERQSIFAQRKNLDRMQKFFLKAVELENKAFELQVRTELQNKISPVNQIFSFTRKGHSISLASDRAVVADQSDIAPVYEQAAEFQHLTTLAASWQEAQNKSDAWLGTAAFQSWEDGCGFYISKNFVVLPAAEAVAKQVSKRW